MHVLTDHTQDGARPAPGLTRRTLYAACMLGLAACHAPSLTPRAGPSSPQALTADQTPPLDADAGDHARLSATDLHLPTPSVQATPGERQFFAAATRAVRHVYEDDIDDPSQLLALRQRLHRDENLRMAQALWQPVLASSLIRAQTLRSLGPTLRALRQALANCWRDEISRSYRDLDQAGCRIARATLPPEAANASAALLDTIVTIEPLGAYPLRVFLRFCDDPRSLFGRE